MDYNVIAGNILKNVGGAQNVADVTHCFTRLRFVLKNRELANKEIVEKLEGVIQVVEANGQFQVVIGTKAVSYTHLLAADPSDIFGRNPVFSDDDDAVCSGGRIKWNPGCIFGYVCSSTWNLFQTSDIYLYAGEWNCTGNAADYRI